MRGNGETVSDAANHFKNFPTVDSVRFGDDFTVLPTFVLTETLEHLKNCGKNTRKFAYAVAEFASAQNALICSLACPNSEDDVIYLRELRWASYRKSV